MIKKLYQKYYKKSFFNKILFTYSIIMVLSLFVLTQIIIMNFGNILQQKELNISNRILHRVASYFDQNSRTALNIYQNMYGEDRNASIRLLAFFENESGVSSEDRIKINYNLADYLISSFRNTDIHDFVVRIDNTDEYYITESTLNSMLEVNNKPSYLSNINKNTPSGFKLSSAHNPSYLRNKRRVFTMAAKVIQPDLSKVVGEIFIEFDVNSIKKAYAEYANDLKGYIVALTKEGDVIFDSSGRFYDSKYPYMDLLNTESSQIRLEEDSIVNTVYPDKVDIMVVGVIPESEIFAAISTVSRSINLILLLCILISIILAYLNKVWISRRVGAITEAMKKLRKGDLTSRIPLGTNEDEITDIAISFNKMCSELETYINRVYLAEIKQKTAQINTLQSQINPHFLYNTLETIRMRAITKGDEEAGEMIHLLAGLFRSSIREEMIIEIRDEIKFCNLYLELFKIRFEDRLNVEVKIQADIEEFGIVKHLLQPVLENYIIHGFDPERLDNKICINGYKSDGDIIFHIEDNGRGIDETRLAEIWGALDSLDSGSSIGLPNVNERLKLIYGENYGLSISSKLDKGTVVVVKIQAMSKKELKEYVQNIDRG